MMNNLPPGVTDNMIENQQEHSYTRQDVELLKSQWASDPYSYTRQDVELLKSQWASDPCWDIETTEGFENYYIELKTFRIGCETKWKQQQNKVEAKAKQLNCSLELAIYILNLEETISEMRDFLIEIGY